MWARDGAGQEVRCRVLDAHRFDRFRGRSGDPREQRLVALAPENLQPTDPDALDRGRVLWKLPGVVDGLADLPRHRYCGKGGHARNCPTVILTICLTEGTPEAGERRVLPGSHRGGVPFLDGRAASAPEGGGLAVSAGDVSLHDSDVMHASRPSTSPDGPHRISALLPSPPAAGHHRGGHHHHNDVLLGNPDGQVDHLADRPGP